MGLRAARTVVTGRELPTIDLVPLEVAPVSGRALVLAAHGSRRDPAANALVRRLAESLRGRRLFDEVAVAFHQGEPGFDAVLDELAADEVTVVPFLTSAGHYSEVVLPEALGPQSALRRGPAAADAAGGHPRGRGAAGGAAGDRAAPRRARSSATRWRSCSWGTARRAIRRAGRPPSTWPKRSAAGASRARCSAAFLDDEPPVDEALAARCGARPCSWCRSSSAAAPTRSRTSRAGSVSPRADPRRGRVTAGRC